jgi:hypothetical protein
MATKTTPPPAPAPRHTPEEMDALLLAAVEGIAAARTAIDEEWASDNTPAYNDAAGAAHLDERKAQDAFVRIIDLVLMTFHPDRAVAALAYGPSLAETIDSLKFTNVAFKAALARHEPKPAEASAA